MSNGIMSVELLMEVNKVTVFGGHGSESKRTTYTDEFGNEFRGTGPEAKSYFRGRHQARSIVFETAKKRGK